MGVNDVLFGVTNRADDNCSSCILSGGNRMRSVRMDWRERKYAHACSCLLGFADWPVLVVGLLCVMVFSSCGTAEWLWFGHNCCLDL